MSLANKILRRQKIQKNQKHFRYIYAPLTTAIADLMPQFHECVRHI